MRNVWIICKKELRSYFVSPIAYLLLALFGFLAGSYFWLGVREFINASMESQLRGETFPMNVNEMIVRPVVSFMNVVGLFLVPIVTMRLFAEEKRTGTIELLATSPLRDAEIISGKWLGALTLYGGMLLLSAVSFLWLFKYGNPDWKPIAVAYLGLLLQAGALLALGMFISTLTRNQIIAGAATFGVCLFLWILQWMGGYDSSLGASVASYVSVFPHFESFSKGVLSSKDTVYYVTLIIAGLFLTARSMESLRWRA